MKRCAFLVLFGMFAAGASAAPRVTTQVAQPRSGRPGYVLFATVAPVQTVVVRAGATGTLANFRVKPGDRVRAGEGLGRIGGPTYAAALASARAALGAARKASALARDRLGAARARYPVLTDRAALDRAKLEVAQAAADLVQKQARYAALGADGTIAAPVAGTVSAVPAGNGERVAPGDAILIVHPAAALWLRGAVYGKTARAVRVGMRGVFRPTGGGGAIAVRVVRRIPGAAEDGLGVGLVATGAAHWFDGEGGLVTLAAGAAGEPAVPTAALVLDRGRWWVMQRNKDGGFAPVRVTPDGSRAGWTWIAAGLRSGDRVAVAGAYLLFHRAFSKHYAGAD